MSTHKYKKRRQPLKYVELPVELSSCRGNSGSHYLTEKGLSCRQRAPIDLILLGLNARAITGVEMLREVRRIDPTIPVTVCTGHALDWQGLLDDLAVNTYLFQKPHRSRALVARVRELTCHPESVR